MFGLDNVGVVGLLVVKTAVVGTSLGQLLDHGFEVLLLALILFLLLLQNYLCLGLVLLYHEVELLL